MESLFRLHVCCNYKAKRVKTRCYQEGVYHFEPRFQREDVVPLPIYWYHSKGNWLHYNVAADNFYIMLIFHWISWISAIFLVPVYLTYWPRKCVIWCVPHGESFHQVWSWYDHPLPSYSIIAADTLRDLVTLWPWPWPLTFWPWWVVIHGVSRDQPLHQVWRSYGYPFLSYEFWHLP